MISILILILTLAGAAFSQEQLTVKVDRNSVTVGETFQVTFTFSGSVTGVSAPILPNMEKLKVVGGPMTGTNVEIGPGRAIATTSFAYVLKAMQVGKGTIGAARVKYKGKEYASSPISIAIQAATGGTSAQGVGSKQSEDVFVRVYPDKTVAYQGEQILLSYKIFFAVQITSPEIVRLPRTAGFWVEEIKLPDHLELVDEVVNGRSYKAAVFRKLALFPTGAGDLEIEPLRIKTNVEVQAKRRGRDPFDIFNDPFFQLGRQMQPVEVESPQVNLRVNPLPSAGVPIGFSGAVGSYQMKASLDRQSCQTHEAVTFSLRIEGIGNIATLAPPSIVFPPDFEHYDPKTEDNIRRERSRVSGAKTFSYVLIPRAAGLQKIPSISFSFFDPNKSKYITLESGDLELLVQKGSDNPLSAGSIPVAGKRGVESIGTDIAFAKMKPGAFVSVSTFPHQQAPFWLLTAGPWAVLAGVALVSRRRMKLQTSSFRYQFKRALGVAMRELSRAEKACHSGQNAQACGHVSAAVERALAARFGLESGTMTSSRLEELWQINGFDQVLLHQIEQLHSECDLSRFGTNSSDNQNTTRLIAEAKRLLSDLEKLHNVKERA
jgi:hypothetical protein